MRYHHLFSDAAGESHWKTTEIALSEQSFAPPARAIHVSEAVASTSMVFLRLHAGWDEPVHPTPVHQTLVCLTGTVRVTASDGAARDIGPGDIWRMEDLTGKGHHTRVTSAEDFEAVIVQHG